MLQRIFANVGSGLFCIEEIDNHIFVYDCGGATQKVVKNRIKDIFSTKKVKIDALFISHYHSDHITY